MFFKAIAAMVAADVFDRHMREKHYEQGRSLRRDDRPLTRRSTAQPAGRRLAGRDGSAPERPN